MTIDINDQIIDTQKLNSYVICNSININKYFENIEPFVDLIVTSPPYYDTKKYLRIEEETGFNQTYDQYLDDIRKTFKGVYDISKNTASLYLNIDTVKRDKRLKRLPDDIANILEEIGWIHKDVIIWDKVKTLPYSRKGQARNVFEYILYFTKSKDNYKYYEDKIKVVEPMHWWLKHPEKYSPKGVAPSNIWKFSIPPQGRWGSKVKNESEILKHACPFPPELMARIILLSSDENDVVFDPYAGTGIFLATAQKLNRRFLGIDLSADSKEIFNKATQNFVESRWKEIRGYYAFQKKLKPIYYNTIINLRILKYIKVLLRRIKSNDIISRNNILFCLAKKIEVNYKKNYRNKYAKASYIIVIENIDDTAKCCDEIKSIISKPPFSKYSLDVEVKFVNVQEFKKCIINELDSTLFVYKDGNIEDYVNIICNDDISKLLNDKIENNGKKEVTIISNIKVHHDDYEIILEETKQQERIKSYAKLSQKYGFL